MGFFGKLFEKKECAICGGEIGLLGNRKLEDGNMCKECAAKLSPWFDDRRNSTVAQIEEQLAYREENKAKVAAFQTTRVFGEATKLYLDEDAKVFMVTSAGSPNDITKANPDVVAFSDVTGCELDINEHRRELYTKDKEGKQISYNPPRYEYQYDFYIIIRVRNPYFDEIKFKINRDSVDIESYTPQRMAATGAGKFLSGATRGINPELSVEYREYKAMGEEIKATLLQVRQDSRDAAAAAAAPKAVVTCPYCGATTTPDESGRCEYCGGAVAD